jgi:CTD small phosphatase-like protein 2
MTKAVAPAPAPAPEPEEGGEDDASYEYEYEAFNPYLFIKLLPAYSTVAPRVPRIVLPKKSLRSPEISLVLDLDETLVHCSVDPIPDADVTFPVTFNGLNYQVYVRKRPHLDKFLQWITGRFEVTIFTASQQVYAERLLNILDPEKKYIKYVTLPHPRPPVPAAGI